MNTSLKWVLMLCAVVAALVCYSMGIQSGVFLFIALGFCLEGAAWLLLFRKKRTSR